MTEPKIPIPEEFASQVRYVPSKDSRTNEEIIAELNQHVPIKSEKNIWTYWHAGINGMPSWNQRNICNWVRLHGPDWTVRVLNTVPDDPNHALTWIEPDQLIESFVNGTMEGPYTGPHSADLLRGAAMYRYGGVWLDVGAILFRNLEQVCWDKLEDESSPYTISCAIMWETAMANAFVAARKNDPYIKHWHELFRELWKGQVDWRGVVASPLMKPIVEGWNFAVSDEAGLKWKWKCTPEVAMGYVGQVLAWHRVAWLEEPNGFNGREYFTTHALCFAALDEMWAAEKILDFGGKDFHSVFTTRRDADPESAEYKKAYEVAWRLITSSALQKLVHGGELTFDDQCGKLLDRNEGSDCGEGTFGELLRYASVHFEQTREGVRYVQAYRQVEEKVIRKGLLEP